MFITKLFNILTSASTEHVQNYPSSRLADVFDFQLFKLRFDFDFSTSYNYVLRVFNDSNITQLTWQKYSFMIMMGIATAFFLGVREGKKLGIIPDIIIDGVLIIVPLSIIGTRLWYVAFEWSQYAAVFKSSGFVDGMINLVDITSGGLAIHGGFFTAFISAYFYAKYKKIDILAVFDIMAPGFLIAQSMGRWGNFFNQEAHGGVIGGKVGNITNLTLDEQRAFLTDTLNIPDFITNNMYFSGGDGLNYYHPTFFYESVWNITGFIIMLVLRRTKLVKQGDMLVIYLIWYSIGRYFIEAMRTDSLFIEGTSIRTAQLTSLLMIAGGVVFAVLLRTVFKAPSYASVLEANREQITEQTN